MDGGVLILKQFMVIAAHSGSLYFGRLVLYLRIKETKLLIISTFVLCLYFQDIKASYNRFM